MPVSDHPPAIHSYAPVKRKPKLRVRSDIPTPTYTTTYDAPDDQGYVYRETPNVVHLPKTGANDQMISHEQGHVYDFTTLTPFERDEIAKQVFHRANNPWQSPVDSMTPGAAPGNEEFFAQAFAWLKQHPKFGSQDEYDLTYNRPPDGQPIPDANRMWVKQGTLQMLKSWLENANRVIRDDYGRPIGMKPEYDTPKAKPRRR